MHRFHATSNHDSLLVIEIHLKPRLELLGALDPPTAARVGQAAVGSQKLLQGNVLVHVFELSAVVTYPSNPLHNAPLCTVEQCGSRLTRTD